MHDSTTTAKPVEAAVMAAIAAVPDIVRAHALHEITGHVIKADLVTDPVAAQEQTDLADNWAALARRHGASEERIDAAYDDGHQFVARWGDDGA